MSLKPSQMGAKIDEALARENIGAVVAKAVETGAFVRIDMEDHRYTDRTLDLWRELRPADRSNGADVGVVIQAALRRSEQDVEAIIAEGGRDPAVQGRLQGARVGRVPGQGRGRRGVRAADAPPAPLGDVPGARHPRRPDHQARDRGRDRGGHRPRRVRVPDALRRPARPPGAAVRGRLARPGLRPVRRASGTRTSCAASPSGRPTSRSCCATCGGSAGRPDAGRRSDPGNQKSRRCARRLSS